jgi:hypothetical protein
MANPKTKVMFRTEGLHGKRMLPISRQEFPMVEPTPVWGTKNQPTIHPAQLERNLDDTSQQSH